MTTSQPPLPQMLTAVAMGALALLFADAAGGQATRRTAADRPAAVSGVNADQVPIQQISAQSANIVKRIDAVATQIAAMLEGAQDERDVVRVLCLADKNNQVGLAVGTARDRSASLTAALLRGAEPRARHEFRLLSVVAERVEFLVTEANQCWGQEVGQMGESSLVVDVDPNMPAPDAAQVATPPISVVVPIVPSPVD
jgi:hypothetical protein